MAKLSSSNPIRIAFTFLFLIAMGTVSVAQLPSNIGAAQGRKITLKQQLTIGLKAFTKADKLFIAKVIAKVEQGKLPRKLVDSTFLWARHRSEKRSYARDLRPMVYFQPGMTLRAKRAGVRL